jgi:hypothetical protein
MKRFGIICILASSFCLSSCQKGFIIGVSYSSSGLHLQFFDGSTGKQKLVTKCVWRIDIVEEQTQISVMTLRAENQCVSLSSIDVNDPPSGLSLQSAPLKLRAGDIYTAQIVADDSNAKSRPWTI